MLKTNGARVACVAVALVLAAMGADGALVNHWKMDEGTGGTAADLAGGYDATQSGGVTWTTADLAPVPSGTTAAMTFDGSDDQLTATGYKGILGTGARSMAAWIKTSDQEGGILAWGTDSPTNKWIFRTQNGSGSVDGNIRVEVNGGYRTSATSITDNTWHHVAATWENDSTPDIDDLQFYIDGAAVGNNATQSKAINTTSGIDLRIGSDHSTRRLAGQLDDVRIYDHALNAQEVRVMALGPKSYNDQVVADDPVGYWRLDEGTGTAANETYKGTTVQGTYAGGTSQTGSGLVASDLANTATEFDSATNGRVSIPDSTEITDAPGNPGFAAKTVELSFNATDNVSDRQVLWVQGGATRGLNLYLDGGDLYLQGWNDSTDSGGTVKWGDGGNEKFVSTPVEASKTYHVAMVYEGESTGLGSITGYLNGVPFATLQGTTTAGEEIGLLFNHGPAKIGSASGTNYFYHNGTQASNNAFEGTIDEVSHYNTALSSARVGAHHAATTTYGNEVLSDNPAAYYRLGETSGTTAHNFGNLDTAVDGTYVDASSQGAAGLVATNDNPAARFDGTTAVSVDIPDSAGINLQTRQLWTAELWFQPDSDISSRQVLYEQGGAGNGYNVYIEGGEVIVGAWKNNGNDFAKYLSAPISSNQKYHVALVFDADNDAFTGYLNGSVFDTTTGIATQNAHSGDIAIAAMRNDSRFDNGGTGIGGSGDGLGFVGTLDEVAIYNSALAPVRLGMHNARGEHHSNEVLNDNPTVFLRMSETATSRDVVNLGSLGTAGDGKYQTGGDLSLNQASLVSGSGNASILFNSGGSGSGHLSIDDNNQLNTQDVDAYSVELWFEATGNVTDRQVLYEQGGGVNGLNIWIEGGNLHAAVWEGGDGGSFLSVDTVGSPLQTNETYFVALTYDSSDALIAYLNGTAFGMIDSGLFTIPSHSGDIGIGGMFDASRFAAGSGGAASGDGYYFTGLIDDLAIFNGVALSRDRVHAHGLIPEPMTMLAVGLGIAGLGGYVRKRRRC